VTFEQYWVVVGLLGFAAFMKGVFANNSIKIGVLGAFIVMLVGFSIMPLAIEAAEKKSVVATTASIQASNK
jgi:uncharacterized membrane protein (DUF485 family)